MATKYCPTCNQPIKNNNKVLPVRKATTMLRREREISRKATMTRDDIKRMFGISDDQIDKIESVEVFGEIRYSKEVVFQYVRDKKIKRQGKLFF
jgi:hypothetical protein